jgi:hypothetical protein
MKTLYISIFIAFSLFMTTGCKKEMGVTASPDPGDAFIRVDDPAIDYVHQTYLFYHTTGVPVLFDDTLRKNPLTLLSYNYFIISRDSLLTGRFTKNNDYRLDGLQFVRDDIYPHLSKALTPYSFLVADSIFTFTGSAPYRTKVNYNVYAGLSTFMIAKISKLKTMSATDRAALKGEALANMIYSPLLNSTLLTAFNAVSAAYYGMYAYGTTTTPYYIPYMPKESYGLLTDGTEYSNYYATGTKEADLKNYLLKVCALSEQDFTAKYGAFPLVMSKYRLLSTALTAIGYIK